MHTLIQTISTHIPEHWKVSVLGTCSVAFGYIALKLELIDAWLTIITKVGTISVSCVTFCYIVIKIYFLIRNKKKITHGESESD